jgi:hypothetical protein
MSLLGPAVGGSRMQAAPAPPDGDFAQEPVVVERLRTTCRFEGGRNGIEERRRPGLDPQ